MAAAVQRHAVTEGERIRHRHVLQQRDRYARRLHGVVQRRREIVVIQRAVLVRNACHGVIGLGGRAAIGAFILHAAQRAVLPVEDILHKALGRRADDLIHAVVVVKRNVKKREIFRSCPELVNTHQICVGNIHGDLLVVSGDAEFDPAPAAAGGKVSDDRYLRAVHRQHPVINRVLHRYVLQHSGTIDVNAARQTAAVQRDVLQHDRTAAIHIDETLSPAVLIRRIIFPAHGRVRRDGISAAVQRHRLVQQERILDRHVPQQRDGVAIDSAGNGVLQYVVDDAVHHGRAARACGCLRPCRRQQ